MKFFWKLLALIYCKLVSGGLKITPPKCLFHQPKYELERQDFNYILADINFTPEERNNIINGIQDLEKFCNGLIKFSIDFSLDPNAKINTNAGMILKINSDNPIIISADNIFKTYVFGLYQYLPSRPGIIYLVHDRLDTPDIYRTTVIHELGHYMGMNHTKRPSIMYKDIGTTLYPTYIDAKEICQKYSCNPQDLRYFKL